MSFWTLASRLQPRDADAAQKRENALPSAIALPLVERNIIENSLAHTAPGPK
jgi:hypothetical protein